MNSNFMCTEYNNTNKKIEPMGMRKQRMVEIKKACSEIVIKETKQQR